MSFNNILSTFSLFDEETPEARIDTIEGLKVRTYHVLGERKHTLNSCSSASTVGFAQTVPVSFVVGRREKELS